MNFSGFIFMEALYKFLYIYDKDKFHGVLLSMNTV
jgi:hypothetical protein